MKINKLKSSKKNMQNLATLALVSSTVAALQIANSNTILSQLNTSEYEEVSERPSYLDMNTWFELNRAKDNIMNAS